MEALRTMLRASKRSAAMGGVIDFNDKKKACALTGFLPLHVAAANSLTSMCNFLQDLPGLSIEFDECRARPNEPSQLGR